MTTGRSFLIAAALTGLAYRRCQCTLAIRCCLKKCADRQRYANACQADRGRLRLVANLRPMPFIDAEAGETLGGPKFRERDGGFITFSPNTLQSNIDALIRNGQRHLRRPSCWKQAREQAS